MFCNGIMKSWTTTICMNQCSSLVELCGGGLGGDLWSRSSAEDWAPERSFGYIGGALYQQVFMQLHMATTGQSRISQTCMNGNTLAMCLMKELHYNMIWSFKKYNLQYSPFIIENNAGNSLCKCKIIKLLTSTYF